MDKEVLESILINADKEGAVQSVLSFEGKTEILSYLNYKSTFSRLVVKVVLGNGPIVKRSLILKEPVTEEDAVIKNSILSFFKTEAMVNNSVLKKMEHLMEEFNCSNDIIWCRLLHHDAHSALLFEDLEAKGYEHLECNFTLDTAHYNLVLRNLGIFHGMCKVLEERGVIVKEDYPTSNHFFSNRKFINSFFCNGFQILQKGILKYWGVSWDSVAERLKIPLDLIEKKLTEISELNETRFNVLNHGDCWINNIMFKYDLDNRPYTMRFLNFQRLLYNSPCLDVTYFMYLSIDPAVRRNNFDTLLKTYYDFLIITLDKYGFKGKKPTYEEISKEMERVSFFGLSLFAVLHAVLTADKLKASDMEQLYGTEGNGFNIEVYKRKSYLIDKMIPDLLRFIQVAGV